MLRASTLALLAAALLATRLVAPLPGVVPAALAQPPGPQPLPAPPAPGILPASPAPGILPAPPALSVLPAPPALGVLPAPPALGGLPAPPAGGGPALAQPAAAHAGPVQALAVAPQGRLLSGGVDHALILWPADLSAPLASSRWHQGPVQALQALPGGGFVSAGQDGQVALWPEFPGAAPLQVLPGLDQLGPVVALAAQDGALLAASSDGTAQLWRPGLAPRRLVGHQGPVTGAAFRADGLPVTAGADGTLRGWPEDAPPLLLAAFGQRLTAVAALPQGGLASAGMDGLVRLLPPPSSGTNASTTNVNSDQPAATGRHLEAGRTPLAVLAAAADGSLLAAAGPAGGLYVWSLPEGRLRHSLPSAGVAVWSLAFSPDAALLYAGGADGRVRAVDMLRGVALGAAPSPAPARPTLRQAGLDMEGARVFRGCGGCHSLAAPPSGQAELKAGPHLGGLFGRRVAGVPGYAYSGRLARAEGVWTKRGLGDLLTPGNAAAGLHEPPQAVDDPEDLAALLRFLEQATKD